MKIKSVTTKTFRVLFSKLPEEIQDLTKRNYKLWTYNKNHPGLLFKQVHTIRPIYSARVGLSYRTLGIIESDEMVWFWIGTHDDYIKLLGRL